MLRLIEGTYAGHGPQDIPPKKRRRLADEVRLEAGKWLQEKGPSSPAATVRNLELLIEATSK